MAHLSQIYKLAIPMLVSSVVMLMANLLNIKILGDDDVQNLYLLALYLPIFYMLTAIFEAARVFMVYVCSDNERNKALVTFSAGVSTCLLLYRSPMKVRV